MEQLPLKFYYENKNGEHMSRFTNDVDIINPMLSSTCVSLVSGIVTLCTTIILKIQRLLYK